MVKNHHPLYRKTSYGFFILFGIIFALFYIGCQKSGGGSGNEGGSTSAAQTVVNATGIWVRTTAAATSGCQFLGVAIDSSGNIYAAGYQSGNGTYTYGSQNAVGNHTGFNAVLVKYDATGTVLWARSTAAGTGNSQFTSVAVDSTGNVFVAGYQQGTSTFTYSGQSITSPASSSGPVLVKYDSSGNALWARTISAGATSSIFWGVSTDTTGNVLVAGQQFGNGTYTYSGQSATGTYSNNNAVIIKYDGSGTGIWARTVSAGPHISKFLAIAIDNLGNAYAAGSQSGTGTYTYGSQSINGSSTSPNAMLVKYDSTGTVAWARTTSSGTGSSELTSVAVDSTGKIITGGYQFGNTAIGYGSLNVTGTSTGMNVLIIQHDTTGSPQWAQTVSGSTTGTTKFNSVAVDSSGNTYVVGYQEGTGNFTYGNRTLTGTSTNNNLIIVKYGNTGTVAWASTVTGGTNGSQFNGVAVNGSGNAYAVGYQSGTSEYNYAGQTATAAGTGTNASIAKYQP